METITPVKIEGNNFRCHVGGYNPPDSKSHGQKLKHLLRNRRLKIGNSKGIDSSISESANFNSEVSNASGNRTLSNSGVYRTHSIKSYQSGKSYKSNATTLTAISSFSGNRPSKTKSTANKTIREEEPSDCLLQLNDKELHSMDKHIPALKGYGRTAAFRQHYYPENGWGWTIAFCCLLVEIMTTGLQLSYGSLYMHVLIHTSKDNSYTAVWIGSCNLSVSFVMSPIIIGICQTKSTRLTGVVGGLVVALSFLFNSFAKEIHQIFISYAIMCGLGCTMVREASSIMLSQYFKRKKDKAEILSNLGSGLGISIFTNVYHYGLESYGWRITLQITCLILLSLFFLGLFYRPASLYHPQRRAILHLKDMSKRKGIDKSKGEGFQSYFSFYFLKKRALRVILVSAFFATLGVYSPLLFLIPLWNQEGLDQSAIVLQTYLGIGVSLGTISFGSVIISKTKQCIISKHYLFQFSLFGIAISILALISIEGYHSYLMFSWMYGWLLGGFQYSLKTLVYQQAKLKQFNQVWGCFRLIQSIAILIGVPVVSYVNNTTNKNGFYFSIGSVLLGAISMFFFGENISLKKKELSCYSMELVPHNRSKDFIRSASGGLIFDTLPPGEIVRNWNLPDDLEYNQDSIGKIDSFAYSTNLKFHHLKKYHSDGELTPNY